MKISAQDLAWGRLFSGHQESKAVFWRDELEQLIAHGDKPAVLAVGSGRSYGDSCLNSGGELIMMAGLNRMIAFDREGGWLRCDSGMTFAEILEVIVPHGWFLPVTPGTMFVTVGGAIANDVHGKNHHVAGTFGCFVDCMEVMSTSGKLMRCSPTENPQLFRATIGGLGLTGVILWAQFRLKRINNHLIAQRTSKFANFDQFLKIADNSDGQFDYTVAWIDSSASGRHLGRGIFFQGNHAAAEVSHQQSLVSRPAMIPVPMVAPSYLLNDWAMKAFNFSYYHRQQKRVVESIVSYRPFFYPLDSIKNWNKLYGPKGFYQFQCVLPEAKIDELRKILQLASNSHLSSFLTVLKKFGVIRSPGMLSFPMAGYTVAFDFRNCGQRAVSVIQTLGAITLEAGGRIYPAKDALMSSADFKAGYSNWPEFSQYIDPGISSDFAKRVF